MPVNRNASSRHNSLFTLYRYHISPSYFHASLIASLSHLTNAYQPCSFPPPSPASALLSQGRGEGGLGRLSPPSGEFSSPPNCKKVSVTSVKFGSSAGASNIELSATGRLRPDPLPGALPQCPWTSYIGSRSRALAMTGAQAPLPKRNILASPLCSAIGPINLQLHRDALTVQRRLCLCHGG